jgi:succinylglutamic semialdehyde dehydrogenase
LGPLISSSARDAVHKAQRQMAGAGGTVLVESTAPRLPGGGWYATPGVVRVDGFTLDEDLTRHAGADVEIFGPLLRLCVADSLDAAIAQANTTRFGLAASIFTRDERSVERFLGLARAGCINVNTGTAGASGKLPFGGLGLSGNHRPAGAFSVDYCAYPVASMVETGSASQTHPGMTFDPRWV